MPRPRPSATLRLFVSALDGVAKAPAPGFIEPCLLTQQAKLPAGDLWQYEVKLDGYRAQIHLSPGRVKIFTRNGLDWTDSFTTIAAAADKIAAHSAVLDGEIVVPGANGVPNFHAIKPAIANGQDRLYFYAFDLLYLDGRDLRGVALADRRRALETLIAGRPGGRILMSEATHEDGADLLRHAAEMGLEGIVAKRIDAPYRSGRVTTWIKVKVKKSMALPIIGYVPAKGGSIAALRLGRREGKTLIYAGKVGTGFSAKSAQTVRERLLPLHRPTPALTTPLKKKDTIWVEPTLTARIELTELTEDGMVRHASFKGLTS